MTKVKIYDKIDFLRNSQWLYTYEKWLAQIGLKVDPLIWITISLFVAIAFGLLTLTILTILNLTFAIIMVLVVAFVVADLLLGYPYLKGMQRINEIEKDLPEALKQMADILKAGGTYEYALRELANSEMGALTIEIRAILRKLEEGENFENSLKELSRNVDSKLVKRTVTIINDSVKAGAGLADILEQIADDTRELFRIEQERKSRTLMQVLFMIAAGAIVSPFIFGLISTVAGFLVETGSGTGLVTATEQAIITANKDFIIILIQIYVFIQVTVSGVMMSLMREGKKSKSIIYIPGLLFIAYLIYFISRIFTAGIIGGI
jgi:archaeal flagellar protein FlaJ